MRRLILPILLLTTATLSLSDVLPIITVNEADSEPTIDDQIYDNTLNNIQDRNNPNIFYEFLIGSSKTDKTSKSQKSASKKVNKKDINEIYSEDNYDDEGFRKKQWHNYPRQLDRLHVNPHSSQRIKKTDMEYEDIEKIKRTEDSVNDIYQYSDEKVDSSDIDAVAVPLLILKIRLAFLDNDLQDINSSNNEYTDMVPVIHTSAKYHRKEDNIPYANKVEPSVIDTSDRQKRYKGKSANTERDLNEHKTVNKRIFSLWSRLQSLSHKGHELQHRRHLYAFYGLPDDGSGTLTAETRATLIRPPGSPLRWG